MAKFGNFTGRPQPAASSSMMPGVYEPPLTGAASRPGGVNLPDKQAQQQQQAFMRQMLQAAMASSQQSQSPALAFLAPLASALMMKQGGGAGMLPPDPLMSFAPSKEDMMAWLDDSRTPDWRRGFLEQQLEAQFEREGRGRPRPWRGSGGRPPSPTGGGKTTAPPPEVEETPPVTNPFGLPNIPRA